MIRWTELEDGIRVTITKTERMVVLGTSSAVFAAFGLWLFVHGWRPVCYVSLVLGLGLARWAASTATRGSWVQVASRGGQATWKSGTAYRPSPVAVTRFCVGSSPGMQPYIYAMLGDGNRATVMRLGDFSPRADILGMVTRLNELLGTAAPPKETNPAEPPPAEPPIEPPKP